MSRTKHTFKGKEFPAKTRKKVKDRKFFGFTSGTHSQFEEAKAHYKKVFEESNPETDPMYKIKKEQWERVKDKTYTEKNVDFVKYGYGQGKKNKVKKHKKEIE
jgi:hypothetical protein